MIKTIDEVLRGRALVSISPGATVTEACARLDLLGVGALAVTREGRLCGILSERDVIRRCIAAGRRTAETLVADIMTRRVVTIGRHQSLAEARQRMTCGRFRHLPVVDASGLPVAVLSMHDIPTDCQPVPAGGAGAMTAVRVGGVPAPALGREARSADRLAAR